MKNASLRCAKAAQPALECYMTKKRPNSLVDGRWHGISSLGFDPVKMLFLFERTWPPTKTCHNVPTASPLESKWVSWILWPFPLELSHLNPSTSSISVVAWHPMGHHGAMPMKRSRCEKGFQATALEYTAKMFWWDFLTDFVLSPLSCPIKKATHFKHLRKGSHYSMGSHFSCAFFVSCWVQLFCLWKSAVRSMIPRVSWETHCFVAWMDCLGMMGVCQFKILLLAEISTNTGGTTLRSRGTVWW